MAPCVVGRDEPGRRLSAAFDKRVDHRGIVRDANHHTPVKTRILAGGIHSAKQQVVRIDRAVKGVVSRDTRALFARRTAELKQRWIAPLDDLDTELREQERKLEELRTTRRRRQAQLWAAYKPGYEEFL